MTTGEGVPLREALKLPPLRQAAVLAGAAGLGRMVRHVNVMEVPDILNWVKPDELLLTTAYPLRDERASLEQLVPSLCERGLAGLAIKPERYIGSIPTTMIEAADRLDFPLLQLPPDTSFDDIINSVLSVILNIQAVRLERAATIHDRFTRIVLGGGGLRQIVQALAELISRPVVIVDPQWTPLAESPGAMPGDFLAEIRGNSRPYDGTTRLQWMKVPSQNGAAVVAVRPIQVGSELHGAVIVLAEEGTLGDEESEAVEHAATVAALRLVQARAVAEADRRFQAVCLEELVTGHVADRGILRERFVAFGWDLSIPRAVLVAELEEIAGKPLAQMAGTPEEATARRRMAEAARSSLGREAIVWERSTGTAALVASRSTKRDELKTAGATLQSELRRRLPGTVVSVGMGRTCADPLELKHSYAEALRALVVARWARGTGQVSLFEDLGLDRLLVSCPEEELAVFHQTTLGRLVDYDAAHGTKLVDTLDTFLSCNGNAAEAARILYVHYNTLKHRLERITEILGPFVGDHDRSGNLSLALRIRRLIGQ